ncbi:kinesin [Neobacillus mesonae]|nr:kinesin [Neobacillus mesonae]
MVGKDKEELERESSSGWEKFLIIAVPIVFTVVLVAVLLFVLNGNVKKNVLELASQIPIVKEWIPEEALDPETVQERKVERQLESNEATIDTLKTKLAAAETELEEVKEQKVQQDNKVKELEEEIKEKQQTTDSSAEEKVDPYQQEIKDLAKMYGQMRPSKAAPIIQSMTLEEQVQLLSEMKSDEQSGILEKMNPQSAAELTTALKEAKTSEEKAIAALQSQLNASKPAEASTDSNNRNLDKTELTQTFATMSAESGANLILEINKLSSDQAMTILKTVDDAKRAELLDSMSSIDKEASAKILNRLMGGK